MLHPIVKKTAILVDGGYYRTKALELWGKKTAKDRADELYTYCMLHLSKPTEPRELYRIFYYDCPPMSRSIKHPLTGRDIDCSSLPGSKWSKDLFRFVSEKPNVALRMGELAESTASFVLKDAVMANILSGTITVSALVESDFRIDVKQKGVDMRIGLDVALMANKQLVDQIILIAGDSDFLPVVKMARKDGVRFILDPMKQNPKHSMIEHVDIVECMVDEMPI